MKEYYIYIMANKYWTLYIWMTGNFYNRIMEHKYGTNKSFARKYNCNRLVYYEHSLDVKSIIEREKQLKKWNRKKKETLIKSINPKWDDLSTDL